MVSSSKSKIVDKEAEYRLTNLQIIEWNETLKNISYDVKTFF